jgi:hypothetical protein
MTRNARRALLIALLLMASGCARFEYNDNVEGTVTLDGKPVPNVLVEFVPQVRKAPLAHGTTDDKGHFKLTCDDGHPGAVVGKQVVVIVVGREGDPNGSDQTASGGSTQKARVRVPRSYALAKTSPLQEEVTKDKHSYELNLKGNAGERQLR